MSDWYYAANGQQFGPLKSADILALHQTGAVGADTLVWTHEFGASWKPFAQSGLTPPEMPPPFAPAGPSAAPPPAGYPASPSAGYPASPNTGYPAGQNTGYPAAPSAGYPAGPNAGYSAAPNTGYPAGPSAGYPAGPSAGYAGPMASVRQPEADAFLNSDLTRAMVGAKYEHYAAKWRKLLGKSNGDIAAATKKTSWHWPAFFIPYAWLFYRKLYKLGGIIFVIQLAFALIPDRAPAELSRLLSFGLLGISIAAGLYANAWYLDDIYKKWVGLGSAPDHSRALAEAPGVGGTNLGLSLVSVAVVLAAAVASALM